MNTYDPGNTLDAISCDELGRIRVRRRGVVGGNRPLCASGFHGAKNCSQQLAEYFFLWATFEDYAVGKIKQLHSDGSQKTGGGLVRDGVVHSIVDAHLPKNRAGFAQHVIVDLADGSEVTLHRGQRVWGGWCPIGLPERNGPAFSAYDEIVDWTGPNGEVAFGLSEYGQIRNVY